MSEQSHERQSRPVEARVGPVAFMAFGGSATAPIALCEYTGATELAVYQKVGDVARREGFRGTGKERMVELGWWVAPVFMRPNQA